MRAEGETQPNIICSYCGKSFAETYVKIHIKRVHEKSLPLNYECQYCQARYENPRRLRKHLISVHFPEKKDKCCHICPKKFASKSALRTHLQTHSEPTFQCPKCDKVFKTYGTRTQHLQSHYPPRFECLVCQQRFVYRSGLKNHLQQVHKHQDFEKHIRKLPKQQELSEGNEILQTLDPKE